MVLPTLRSVSYLVILNYTNTIPGPGLWRLSRWSGRIEKRTTNSRQCNRRRNNGHWRCRSWTRSCRIRILRNSLISVAETTAFTGYFHSCAIPVFCLLYSRTVDTSGLSLDSHNTPHVFPSFLSHFLTAFSDYWRHAWMELHFTCSTGFLMRWFKLGDIIAE